MLFFLIICAMQTKAQVIEVAGWSIKGMGTEENKIGSLEAKVLGAMFIQDGQTWLLMSELETKDIILTVQIENLFLDQTVAKSNSYVGMKSKVKVSGVFQDSGYLYINLAKEGGQFDVFHLDLSDGQLFFSGSLLEESMVSRLAKLSALGVVINNGGKLKIPIEEYLLGDD